MDIPVPGHSPIPKSLFWARRALKGDPTVETNDLVIKFISMVENEAKVAAQIAGRRQDLLH